LSEHPRGVQLTSPRLLLRRWHEDDRAPFAQLNADRVDHAQARREALQRFRVG
jgi:hypothetical protein